MRIEVHFKDFLGGGLRHVANVYTPDEITNVDAGLEYAWRWTNNVEGSWSIKREYFPDGERNGDFNEYVVVVAPLQFADGRNWGHRSSMMGDIFMVGGRRFEVAGIGFRELNPEEGADA